MPSKKTSSSQEIRALREYNRRKKQESRERQSEADKEREREYARKRYYENDRFQEERSKEEYKKINRERATKFNKEHRVYLSFNLSPPYSSYMEYMKEKHGLSYPKTVQQLVDRWGVDV